MHEKQNYTFIKSVSIFHSIKTFKKHEARGLLYEDQVTC